jgi:hypothetical protein
MKVTKSYLKKIIKEEILKEMQEPSYAIGSPTVRDLYSMGEDLGPEHEELRKNINKLWNQCINSIDPRPISADPSAKEEDYTNILLRHQVKIYKIHGTEEYQFMWESSKYNARPLFKASKQDVEALGYRG